MNMRFVFSSVIMLLAVMGVINAKAAPHAVDSLNKLVSEKLGTADTAGLYSLALTAVHTAGLSDNRQGFPVAARNLAIYHENFGVMDSALYYYNVMKDFYYDQKDTAGMARSHLDIEVWYNVVADYPAAMNELMAALALYEITDNQRGIANCYTGMCNLLYYEEKYAESADYCQKAVMIFEKLDEQRALAQALRFKASSLLFVDGELETALETINRAITICRELEGDDFMLMASLNGRGNILKYMERYDEALADYRNIYERAKAKGYTRFTLVPLANIGHVYVLQEKYEEALPYSLEAIQIMEESGDTKNLWENYMHVSTIYENMGDPENALIYHKLYAEKYNEYQDGILERVESEARVKYETAQKDEQIAQQETRIEQQRQIELLYISIGVLLLISLAGMLHSRYRLRKKQHIIENSRQELESSLKNLKATQTQLIHAEKMASLGELTAGIAHEIQNPLNFVNNFSEVNTELIEELKEELKNGNLEEVKAIVDDLAQNEQKINHHGLRADGIVKGMLLHSRTGSGRKESANINTMADEYLRLAYHGLRAKDKSFNADFKLEADDKLPQVKVMTQDIGRVLLNLINNAFFTVYEKSKEGEEGYRPEVVVSTKTVDDKVEISVKDNGKGIPEEIKDKIFQPFFTTKPTGEGTGLGLSMSYDIIKKGHGGEVKVKSELGSGTELIITLPIE